VRDFVFARPGASFATPQNAQAAGLIQQWARNGYFTPNFNGVGYDPAWQQFAKGKGPFLIGGTWLTADIADRSHGRIGFMLMPPLQSGAAPSALGGTSLPFAITSHSRHPQVAAAYLDFLTGRQAARVMSRTNNLAAVAGAEDVAAPDPLTGEVRAAWRRLIEDDGLVPYLDYTTPTAYDTLTQQLASLLAGTETPRGFVSRVERDAVGYRSAG